MYNTVCSTILLTLLHQTDLAEKRDTGLRQQTPQMPAVSYYQIHPINQTLGSGFAFLKNNYYALRYPTKLHIYQ